MCSSSVSIHGTPCLARSVSFQEFEKWHPAYNFTYHPQCSVSCPPFPLLTHHCMGQILHFNNVSTHDKWAGVINNRIPLFFKKQLMTLALFFARSHYIGKKSVSQSHLVKEAAPHITLFVLHIGLSVVTSGPRWMSIFFSTTAYLLQLKVKVKLS